MTPDLVAVDAAWTVKEVLDYVREHGQDSETLNVIYVVDERGKLIDDIRIREFLLKPLEMKVSDLMDENFIALNVTDSQEEAVNVFRKYDRTALPVLDSSGVLVGLVTIDDMLDVAEEEATEDIQKLGGSSALDAPYLTIRFPHMIRKRAPWLVILFLSEMLTATAMGFFEDEIAKAVVLALFVPLIISSGGNSGGQATTLIIRAMALGEVALRDWWRVMRREVFSGLDFGHDSGDHRISANRSLVNSFSSLWSALATDRFNHLFLPYRRGHVGNAFGFDVAVCSASRGARSGSRFRAICRHPRRCYWIGYLLFRRAPNSPRLALVSAAILVILSRADGEGPRNCNLPVLVRRRRLVQLGDPSPCFAGSG